MSKSITNKNQDVNEDVPNAEEFEVEKEEEEEETPVTFASLNISPALCKIIEDIGWIAPTNIQRDSIPGE